MKNDLLSVIVPLYNAEKTIEKCLNSILNQTYQNLEVIVINDGSIDNSEIVVRRIAENDNRVKYYYQSNSGSCAALNNGISHCKGKWISFVDNDDYLDVFAYKKMIDLNEDKDLDIIIQGYYLEFVDEGYRIERNSLDFVTFEKSSISRILPKIIDNNLFHTYWNKVYRRDIINKNNICFDNRYNSMGDFLFNCEYFMCIENMGIISNNGYHYAKYDRESLVTAYVENSSFILQKRREETRKLFNYYCMLETNKGRDVYTNLYYLSSEDFILNLFKKKCLLSKKEKITLIKNNIFDDESKKILDSLKSNNMYSSIFKWTYSKMSSNFVYVVYNFLSKAKYGLYPVYVKMRKISLKRRNLNK
ncbi:MAG: glycosyltransferase family 2 protein [Erysipelotrichales bacterium]|nr:glycosyltransferase family 2 protein [Erysipelotrichales bacterium]